MTDPVQGSAAPLTHTAIPSCEDPKRPACLACTDAADRCIPWPCAEAGMADREPGSAALRRTRWRQFWDFVAHQQKCAACKGKETVGCADSQIYESREVNGVR